MNHILLLSPDPVIHKQGLSILEKLYPPSIQKGVSYSTYPKGIRAIEILDEQYWRFKGTNASIIEVYLTSKPFNYPSKIFEPSPREKHMLKEASCLTIEWDNKADIKKRMESNQSVILRADTTGIIALNHVYTDRHMIEDYIKAKEKRQG